MNAIKSNNRYIEYVEQPLDINAWDDCEKLLRQSEIAIMLDESISNEDDIRLAAKIGVSHIKLKLFKHGGISETGNLALIAKKLGLKVILGNGVSTDIGNIAEAYIYNMFRSQFEKTTEANGFTKCVFSLTNNPPKLTGNKLMWKYSDSLKLTENKILEKWKF